jgi:hypothetical protein
MIYCYIVISASNGVETRKKEIFFEKRLKNEEARRHVGSAGGVGWLHNGVAWREGMQPPLRRNE